MFFSLFLKASKIFRSILEMLGNFRGICKSLNQFVSSLTADHYFWCSGVFLAVSRVFRGIMGCSRGVPGLFWAVPGCSGGVTGMFRGVPGCSGVFRGVPGCSGFYRHPYFREVLCGFTYVREIFGIPKRGTSLYRRAMSEFSLCLARWCIK